MTEQRRSPNQKASKTLARRPGSALRPLVLAMAGWSAGVHAQAVSSAIPDLPVAEPSAEQAPEAPPVSGELVPRLAEPGTAKTKPAEPDENPPTSVSGERMTGYSQRGVELEGNAELRRAGGVVKGDK